MQESSHSVLSCELRQDAQRSHKPGAHPLTYAKHGGRARVRFDVRGKYVLSTILFVCHPSSISNDKSLCADQQRVLLRGMAAILTHFRFWILRF
jgi:hypothetical protein